MTKILEKMYGERIILVCENNVSKTGTASIKLIGNNREIETTCNVMLPKNCFSEPTVMHVMLPKGFKEKELESIEAIEFI